MDWVKAHFDCSVDHAWIVFRERVKDDFAKWKEATGDRGLNQSDDGNRSVFSRSDRMSDSKDYVTVEISGRELISRTNIGADRGSAKITRFMPTTDKHGECRLSTIEGDSLEYWEASRLILLPLLAGQ